MGLRFQYKECPGKTIMQAENLAFAYSGNKEDYLFSHISFAIGRNDRIGIIGKNGKGKSTLLNILAGELEPSEGKITSHPSKAQGHLGQTNIDRLHGDHTIMQEIATANPLLPTTAIRNICGSMMFEGELAEKKISVLSGGERSRVMLGKILANPTNLLLLDEPTNHLDMESIEILQNEINRYPGAVVLVSHSEALLRATATKLVVFNKNGADFFLGNYDEFLEKVGWEEEDVPDKGHLKTSTLTKKEIHARRQVIIKERAQVCNPLTQKLSSLEEQVMGLEERLESLQLELNRASEQQNASQVLAVSTQIGELEQLIQVNFEQMEKLESELLQHNQHFDQLLADIST